MTSRSYRCPFKMGDLVHHRNMAEGSFGIIICAPDTIQDKGPTICWFSPLSGARPMGTIIKHGFLVLDFLTLLS